MKVPREGINALAKPSGTGCVECLASGSWWFHLRRCTECGHIGCCDSSPNQHASKHHATTGHPVITSFEPGERWFYDYRSGEFFAGPTLPAPHSHPLDQSVPGPSGLVPPNWQHCFMNRLPFKQVKQPATRCGHLPTSNLRRGGHGLSGRFSRSA